MGSTMMEDEEQLITGSRVESRTTKGCGCGHVLDPKESSLNFNTVPHQWTLFMSFQHSYIIRLEKGIKYE